MLFNRGQIVAGVENAGVLGANGLRAIRGIVFAAAGAFEMSQHAMLSLTVRASGVRSWVLGGGSWV